MTILNKLQKYLLAAFWEDTSVDAEVDDEKNGENEHNNGDYADDYDLHCCKERPETAYLKAQR